MKLPKSIITADVQKLFKTLGQDQVRFVGGVVRNALLGVPTGDIDLATTLTPNEVIQKLTTAKIKYVPTGIDHGTVTAVLNGIGYEITTLRRDVETDGRRAVVAYTTDWAEDAARRDFTMNALYADLDGKIYDPLGQGLADLEKRKVRFVGDAETRIQEDYLRILRFFRFHSAYGKGVPDKKGLAASAKFAFHIKTLSRERITQEFTKILMGKAPRKILKIIQTSKILPDIIGQKCDPDRIGSELKIEKILREVEKDVLFCARLFIALGFSFKANAKFFNYLILNKKQNAILNDLAKIKIDTKRLQKSEMMKLLYFYSWNSVATALIISAVKENISLNQFKKTWKIFTNTKRPVFMISGKDLQALGYSEGIEMGQKLKSLEKKWISSEFNLTREDLLKPLIASMELNKP